MRKGGIYSSLLLIALMDELAWKAKNKSLQLEYRKLTPTYIDELLYANDLILIVNSKEGWTEVLRKIMCIGGELNKI